MSTLRDLIRSAEPSFCLLSEGAPGLHFITPDTTLATVEVHRNVLGLHTIQTRRNADHALSAAH